MEITINPKFKIGENVYIDLREDSDFFSIEDYVCAKGLEVENPFFVKCVISSYNVYKDKEGVQCSYSLVPLYEDSEFRHSFEDDFICISEQDITLCDDIEDLAEYMISENKNKLLELEQEIEEIKQANRDILESKDEKLKEEPQSQEESEEVISNEEQPASQESNEDSNNENNISPEGENNNGDNVSS